MFDANECALDWFLDYENVRQYVDLLFDVIVAELFDILRGEYEHVGQ